MKTVGASQGSSHTLMNNQQQPVRTGAEPSKPRQSVTTRDRSAVEASLMVQTSPHSRGLSHQQCGSPALCVNNTMDGGQASLVNGLATAYVLYHHRVAYHIWSADCLLNCCLKKDWSIRSYDPQKQIRPGVWCCLLIVDCHQSDNPHTIHRVLVRLFLFF